MSQARMCANWAGLIAAGWMVLSGCASSAPVRQQAYAQLKTERHFEAELPAVWKATLETLRNHKLTRRDPEGADAQSLRRIEGAWLETDWTYAQSRDKYVEYRVNGAPRRQPLQIRFKHRVELKRVMGGTEVRVRTEEELEKLDTTGKSQGYSSVSSPDSSRAGDLLDRIDRTLLSAAP